MFFMTLPRISLHPTPGCAPAWLFGVVLALAAVLAGPALRADDLSVLAADPLGRPAAFQPVTSARLNTAAARLRTALGPLRSLLNRSGSGANWRKYLDWPAL